MARECIYREDPRGPGCSCLGLFRGFRWHELRTLSRECLPESPGVYVLKVAAVGRGPGEAYRLLDEVFARTGWRELQVYARSRLGRLSRIDGCPVLYIGSTGSLRSRLGDLAGRRHTVFIPLLALLLADWDIDYGFIETGSLEEARDLEKRLLRGYRGVHGRLPPLVSR